MISIVLYGRNDNYGYNLHKRAALSLNCMAEVLTDPDDEILFVDYNTDDDFPTFPEAIQDTLTDKARRMLRVFRVRPAVHARWKSATHLVTLEPLARNVAVRRSNANNRFILSTNTDMIFVPRHGVSLTEIVRDLPYGYYYLPRFEIPETLWEGLDRKDARAVIETVGGWGWNFYLNEIVYGFGSRQIRRAGRFPADRAQGSVRDRRLRRGHAARLACRSQHRQAAAFPAWQRRRPHRRLLWLPLRPHAAGDADAQEHVADE